MRINNTIRQQIKTKNSLVCVGLDTDPQKIPAHLMKKSDPLFLFNKMIIDATHDRVLAYKPNLAFYEALGKEGWELLKRTVDYIPEGILKIGDAKRGDIGNTARQYARALFELGFDMVTVNAYLGWDSVAPFVEDESRGVFILCLTSNASSRDFQYLTVKNEPFYLYVARKIQTWNKNGNCGLVAGATHPEELKKIRNITPDLPFLIPGIGAQGGDLEGAIQFGTDNQGEMAIINSSRSILYASQDENFAEAAREQTIRLQNQINDIRTAKTEGNP